MFHGWGKQEVGLDCYGGNDQQFWLKLADNDKVAQMEVQTTIFVFDGLPYIQIILKQNQITVPKSHTCSSCAHQLDCASCATANNLSVLSAQNDNLTSAQKSLLLHHQ